MSDEIWNKKREMLENELKDDALDLFSHMGGAGACKIPIPNTSPQVFIVVGDERAIKSLSGNEHSDTAGGVNPKAAIIRKAINRYCDEVRDPRKGYMITNAADMMEWLLEYGGITDFDT